MAVVLAEVVPPLEEPLDGDSLGKPIDGGVSKALGTSEKESKELNKEGLSSSSALLLLLPPPLPPPLPSPRSQEDCSTASVKAVGWLEPGCAPPASRVFFLLLLLRTRAKCCGLLTTAASVS